MRPQGASCGGPAGGRADDDPVPRTSLALSVVLKVGMIGDSQIGKTSLMVKYVEVRSLRGGRELGAGTQMLISQCMVQGSFDEEYVQTLGASLSCGCE